MAPGRRTPGEPWPAWLALAKISKVTFWFIWLTPLVFGYVAAATVHSPRHLAMFVGAAIGVCLLDTACNVHNELVDRDEDAVNQPNRTRLLAAVPPTAAWTLVGLGYAYALAGLAAVTLVLGRGVAAVIVTTTAVSLAYNAGPRLKRRPVWSELAIGWTALSAFLFGWSFNAPLADVPPIAWLLTYFMTVTVCLKDLPDAAGDEQVGAARLVNARRAGLRTAALGFIYISPYVVAAALVVAGHLPARLLAIALLLPVAVWLAVRSDRQGPLTRMIAMYQLGFLYVHAFTLGLFLLTVLTPTAAVAVVLLFLARLAALYLGLDPRLVEPDYSWSSARRSPIA